MLGQKIHDGRRRDQDQGQRRVDQGHDDCHQINEEGDEIFARHGFVEPLKLQLVMMLKRAESRERAIPVW